MERTEQIGFRFGGKHFPVYIGADNRFYAFDPGGHLPGPHGELPGASAETMIEAAVQHSEGLHGLGTSTTGLIAENVIPKALSFVPVVGPVLGPIAGAISGLIGQMFGGNDPTPAGKLIDDIVQLRQGIMQFRNALGIADKMPTLPRSYAHEWQDVGGANGPIALACILEQFPQNAGISDNNHWTCDWSGVNCPGCGNSRKCMYATINKLQPIAQSLQSQYNALQQKNQVAAAVQAAVAAQIPAATAPAPTIVQAAPYVPYSMAVQPSGPPVLYQPTGYNPNAYVAPVTAPAQSSMLEMLTPYTPFLLVGGVLLMVALGIARPGPAPRRKG